MCNRDLRLFLTSFLVTLLFAGWFAVFLTVDAASSHYESRPSVPALGLSRAGPLEYDVAWLGQEYVCSLRPVDAVQRWRKQYACLVTPRKLLAAEQLYSIALHGGEIIYDSYKEYQYQQNVAKQSA